MKTKINFLYFSTSRMICGGMFDYWERKELRKTKAIYSKKQNENNNYNNNGIDQLNKPLTMGQLQSAFYLFVIGIVVSILLIIIEMILSVINYHYTHYIHLFKFECDFCTFT